MSGSFGFNDSRGSFRSGADKFGFEEEISELSALKEKFFNDISQLRLELLHMRPTLECNSNRSDYRIHQKLREYIHAHFDSLLQETLAHCDMY